jgi:hypothetical protein
MAQHLVRGEEGEAALGIQLEDQVGGEQGEVPPARATFDQGEGKRRGTGRCMAGRCMTGRCVTGPCMAGLCVTGLCGKGRCGGGGEYLAIHAESLWDGGEGTVSAARVVDGARRDTHKATQSNQIIPHRQNQDTTPPWT